MSVLRADKVIMPIKEEWNNQQTQLAQRTARISSASEMEEFTVMVKAEQVMFLEVITSQLESAERVRRAQQQAAEKERNFLLRQICELVEELVKVKNEKTLGFNPSSEAKFKVWKTTWDNYAKMNQINLEDAQSQSGKKLGRIKKVNHFGNNNPATTVHITHPVTNKSLVWHKAIAYTGAEECVAGVNFLRELGLGKKDLEPANHKMIAFNGSPEPCLGVLKIKVANQHYKMDAEVNICPHVTENLFLSLEACKKLGYVHEEFPQIISPKQRHEFVRIMSDQSNKSTQDGESAKAATPSAQSNKSEPGGTSSQHNTRSRKVVVINRVRCVREEPDVICPARKQGRQAGAPKSGHRGEQKQVLTLALHQGQKVRVWDKVSKHWNLVATVVRSDIKQRNYLLLMDHHYFWHHHYLVRPNPGVRDEHTPEPSTTLSSPMQSTQGRRRTGDRARSSSSQHRGDSSTSSSSPACRKQQKPHRPDQVRVRHS